MAYSKNRRLAEIVSDTSGNLSVEGIVVPTQSSSDNDTSAASTAFVHAHIDAVLDSAPGTLNTLNEIAAALNDDANFNTTVTNAIAAKAPLNGPTFTGTITGPHIVSTSNTATQFKNATDQDVQHKLETNAGSDFAIHRLIGSDGLDNKFIIGYGPNHGSTANHMALKNVHASGSIGFNTGASSVERLHIDSSGNLLVSRTSDSGFGKLQVYGGADLAGGNVLLCRDTGKVGIGETSPLGKLHVKEGDSGQGSVNANFDQLVLEDDAHSGMTILSGTSSDGGIYFGDSGGNNLGQFKYKHSSNSFAFVTNNGNESLVIDSSGNVGIGESNPGASLHITSNTPIISFDESDTSQEYKIGSYGGTFALYDETDSAFRFVVDGSGKFGIGTTAPAQLLEVSGNGGKSRFTRSGSTGTTMEFYSGGSQSGGIQVQSTGLGISGTNGENQLFIKAGGNVGIGTTNPPSPLSIFGLGTSSPIAANAQQSYDNALLRINNFGNSSVGLSIGSTGSNWTHLQTSYNEGTTSPLALNPFGGGVYIGTNTALFSGANLQIHGSTDAGGSTQHVAVKNTTTASFSSTAFVGTGRVLDFFTNSNNDQDFSAIRFTNPGGSRETAIAVVEDGATTRDGTRQGDLVIQGYDGDGYIETQRFRANGASSSTGQRRTGGYTSFAYINHTYTFDHNNYSTAGTPSNTNDHWLEVPLYSSYSTSAGGGWVEIDICWHTTHAQAGHLHSYKLVWGSNHTRVLNVSVISSSANATSGSYGPYAFTSSSRLYRHPTTGDANMTKMYIEIKGSTNHSGARSITLRGVGHPSVKNIAPVIDHGGDSTPDGITPTSITSAITATG